MVRAVGSKVLVLIVLFSLLLPLAYAEDTLCTEDSHCTDLGDTYTCDLDYYICVDSSGTSASSDGTDSSSSDSSTDSDTITYCAIDDDCTTALGTGYICNISTFECEADSSTGSSSDGSSDGTDSSGSDSSTDTSGLESAIEDNTAAISDLSTMVDGMNTRLTTSETSLTSISSEITDLSTVATNTETATTANTADITDNAAAITDISARATNLEVDSHDAEKELNTLGAELATGMAVMQQEIDTAKGDLDQTKSELEEQASKSKNFRTITLIVAVFAVFASIAYMLMLHSKRQAELPKEVKEFITNQIKQNNTKTEILKALEKSGWSKDDAKWAYEHTKAENYNDYLISQGKDPKHLPARKLADHHHQKGVVITVISILVLGALLFFVKNSVGHAVYTSSTGTEAELNESVEDLVSTYVDQNEFYDNVEYFELCVQVDDGDYSASYLVLKTPYGHSITENDPCEWDPTDYEFAVKFTNYESFEYVATTTTCTTANLAHQVLSGSSVTRGVYVLPSYYVEEGETVAKDYLDYSDFCDALSLCFSDDDIESLEIYDC